MSPAATLNLRVREAETMSPLLKRFVLEAADRSPLPTTGPGAHLRLLLNDGRRSFRNAYSISATTPDNSAYEIIVRRVAQSRGGSAFLHEQVDAGAIIAADFPSNLFPLSQVARKHLLISGGIGLTPFLAYLAYLKTTSVPFELHHFCRIEETETFERLLRGYDGGTIHLHPELTQFDLIETLRTQPLGTHLYVCGPEGLMDMALAAARSHGWPGSKLHSESFGAPHAGGAPFVAILKRSGLEIHVAEDQTLLEAIEAAGLEPPCLCRGGACGQCQTEVVEGEPEHRDHYLDAAEHADNRSIMICVSRAKGDRIVLDL
jgi:dimethylamine monooxygenase subunit B